MDIGEYYIVSFWTNASDKKTVLWLRILICYLGLWIRGPDPKEIFTDPQHWREVELPPPWIWRKVQRGSLSHSCQ
jgi:hypothetical protein